MIILVKPTTLVGTLKTANGKHIVKLYVQDKNGYDFYAQALKEDKHVTLVYNSTQTITNNETVSRDKQHTVYKPVILQNYTSIKNKPHGEDHDKDDKNTPLTHIFTFEEIDDIIVSL